MLVRASCYQNILELAIHHFAGKEQHVTKRSIFVCLHDILTNIQRDSIRQGVGTGYKYMNLLY